jgi:predicted nucleotidyltransferase component of viral defense system
MPKHTVLTEHQISALDAMARNQDLSQCFVLSGGTALSAFYTQHRLSEDLDFFSHDAFDPSATRTFVTLLQKQIGADNLEVKKIFDRHVYVLNFPNEASLKIEFTLYPYEALEKTKEEYGIRIASQRDLVVDKLAAFFDRFEVKDFVDLYIVLSRKEVTLEKLTNDLTTKFHQSFDPLTFGALCMRAHNIQHLPRMLIDLSVEDLTRFYEQLAGEMKAKVIEDAS